MKQRFIYTFIALACMLMLGVSRSMATVTVTLTIDETADRPAALNTAARNLGALLSEINRAQDAKTILSTGGLAMNEFALKSLVRLWAVTPFYCDDDEVVERCWVFKNGTMMVSHIPLIITPDHISLWNRTRWLIFLMEQKSCFGRGRYLLGIYFNIKLLFIVMPESSCSR